MNCTAVDYDHCIVNVMNSVREYMGISVHHPGDAEVSCWLHKNQFEQVVVLLIDGMGSRLISAKLPQSSYLRSNMLKEVTTVYPSTTAAVTTCVATGKTPVENGWVGWHQYFSELDDSVIMFMNRSFYHDQSYPGYSYQHVPFVNQVDEMKARGISACELYPAFRPGGAHDFKEMTDQIVQHSHDQDVRFIYAYWDEFDTLAHHEGPSSQQCTGYLNEISDLCEKMADRLDQRTGVLIIADHGQIDVENIDISQDRELLDCLYFMPTLETRGTAYHVKKECHEKFERLFNQKYGQWFILKPSEQWVKEGLFGQGEPHPRVMEFLGDYYSVAIDRYCIGLFDPAKKPLKGQHAGTVTEEMMIPVITCQKK